MMTGYHWYYIGANLSLAMAALFKTSTFLLLGYYVDNVLGNPEYKNILPWVAARVYRHRCDGRKLYLCEWPVGCFYCRRV